MYVSDRIVGKILKELESGKTKVETKKTTEYNLKEIKYAIEQLLDENSKYYNPTLHKEIMAREEAYEKEKEEKQNKALSLLEIDGSLENAKEQTGLLKADIDDALKKLKKENPKREEKIQAKIEKDTRKKEKKERQLDEEIINLIVQEKLSMRAVAIQKSISPERVKKAVDNLNKSETEKKYLEVTTILKDTLDESRKQGIGYKLNFKEPGMDIARLMIENNLPLEHVAMQMNVTNISELILKLQNITDKEILEKTLPFLDDFEKKFNSNRIKNPKKLTEYPDSVQKDIILTALTFRVPIEWMLGLFNTTIDELLKLYKSFDLIENNYWEALKVLNNETKNEEERINKLAYQKAAQYWQERNRLAKTLNKAQEEVKRLTEKLEKTEDKSAQESVKENIEVLKKSITNLKKQLTEHHKIIDDSIITGVISKNSCSLTIEEKDAIAKFRLKYYMPMRKCEEILHLDHRNIRLFEEDLATRDPIYADKLNILNGHYKEFSNQNIKAEFQKQEEKQQIQEALNSSQYLNYFNFSPQLNWTTEDKQSENPSQGRGTR